MRGKLKGILVTLLLALMTISFLYPLYYMLANSLKTRADYFARPFALPGAPLQLANYATMISQFRILNLFKNSFVISALTVVLLLAAGTFASYVFAKYRFKGRGALYVAVLVTMFIPSQVTIIPLYLLF